MYRKIEAETPELTRAPAPGRSRLVRRSALALAPIALVAAGVAVFNREPAAAAAPPPPTVTVSTPLVREISEWDEFVGRFEASKTVEVRPRVSGPIVGLHFRDGETVTRGQLLFTIDPRPFAAALAEARAGLAGAQSDLILAREDLGRATRLLDVDGVSRSDVDRIRARVRAGEAAVAAARARIEARALDLSFTRITAPVAGRISDRRVDPGNIVAAAETGGGTLLTTINAVDPIYFAFDGSEALFLKLQRAGLSRSTRLPVEIRLQDESEYRWRGTLDFTDNGLDPRSGTIRGRAVLANADRFLAPGMFGNMRLSTGEKHRALLVPDAAVQTDQARKIVLVVGRDGKAAQRSVETGPLVDGLRVIRSGLTPRDRVIVSGTQLAMPGAPVSVKAGRIEAAARVAPAAPRTPGGGATLTR